VTRESRVVPSAREHPGECTAASKWMGTLRTDAYYETYWSKEGIQLRTPGTRSDHGEQTPGLRALLETHMSPGTVCIDVGCGDGRTAGRWLVEHDVTYFGADVSPVALMSARASGLNVLQISDAGWLPFRSCTFDRAVCIEVLEHLFAPQRTAAEIFRVLRPGGILVATVPNVAYWRRRIDLALLGRWQPLGDKLSVEQPWRDPHIRFFNPGSLRRLLRSVGFTDVVVGGHDGSILGDIPVARRFRNLESRAAYRFLETVLPSPFGYRLHAIAHKPHL
jgi:SAM-dependent methyltransferase